MTSGSIRPFDFESFGVAIRITGGDQGLIDWGEEIARKALIDDLRVLESNAEFASVFELSYEDDRRIKVLQDGRLEALDAVRDHITKYFNSIIRVAVAEHAEGKMFVHAGAVGWKGKGIVFPGTSFVGKSTLVAELVRQGAEYFSDDYAIFDTDGFLYPFPRTLTMRKDEAGYTPYEVTAAELGGNVGRGPIQVGLVCLTEYVFDAEWTPNRMTPGQASLEMVPYTFSFVNRPEFSLSVLNKIVERAIIVSGKRGSADKFAKTFLNFIDKLLY
jgi:hypothetical protein